MGLSKRLLLFSPETTFSMENSIWRQMMHHLNFEICVFLPSLFLSLKFLDFFFFEKRSRKKYFKARLYVLHWNIGLSRSHCFYLKKKHLVRRTPFFCWIDAFFLLKVLMNFHLTNLSGGRYSEVVVSSGLTVITLITDPCMIPRNLLWKLSLKTKKLKV